MTQNRADRQLSISGLFELHLIVDQKDDPLLFSFVMSLSSGKFSYDNRVDPKEILKKLSGIKPTCARTFYGKYPNQPMLTAWYNGTSRDAIVASQLLYYHMTQKGMTIHRVKVESMAHNEGVPKSSNAYDYFEFHFKVKIKTPEEWNRVANICAPYGAHLFFNSYSLSGRMQPVVTLRCYSMLRTLAELQMELLKTKIIDSGFECEASQREYSILDSAVLLDEGWLFEGQPSNFLKRVPVQA